MNEFGRMCLDKKGQPPEHRNPETVGSGNFRAAGWLRHATLCHIANARAHIAPNCHCSVNRPSHSYPLTDHSPGHSYNHLHCHPYTAIADNWSAPVFTVRRRIAKGAA
jgi:hypothetical protein